MLNYFVIFSIVIILIILIIVITKSQVSSVKTLESYGEYCGRYMYGRRANVGKLLCKSDKGCTLKKYTARDGTKHPFCTINPEPPYEGAEYDDDDEESS
jgi:hypothetical protein